MNDFAVIGGSGLEDLPDFALQSSSATDTPWGEASHPALHGSLAGYPLCFLPRHGRPHQLPPHRINYRANLWLLHQQGIRRVLAVNAVGGVQPELTPGQLLVPDQLIDYTWGRGHSFHDRDQTTLEHVDFSFPYCADLRRELLRAIVAAGENGIDGGVFAVTQGPRLETAAEVVRLRRDGADVVGMTGMPEAALARELGLTYVSLCLVVNPAAGLTDQPVDLLAMRSVLESAAGRVSSVLIRLLAAASE